MPTHRLSVPDMSCGHCVTTVESALEAIQGVDEAKASLETKEVNVQSEEGVTRDDLMAAIRQAGYTPEPSD